MATEILAPGYTTASSAEQNVPALSFARLLLTPAPGGQLTLESRVFVEIKTSAGEWIRVGDLAMHGSGHIAAEIDGPAVFRVTRPAMAATSACGVDLV